MAYCYLKALPASPFAWVLGECESDDPNFNDLEEHLQNDERLQMAFPGLFTFGTKLGRLKVKVIKATNLLAADPQFHGGKSDPYVVVSISGREVRTSVKVQNLNPVWNETLH